ncbi:S9 family peptidase [Alkalicaulis satelles]|uniref:S9 family peptidase n=2 Tax=Alkalicaulis satelles TaxID=2609175 RepID=A0A5M6ZH63_9PROT|nr:S9 family peptidase [Alkalicaulis satelles]
MAAAAAAIILAHDASAQSARPIPAEAFAKVPDIQSVSMSDDGRTLVGLVADPSSDNQRTALATWDLSGDSLPQVLSASVITPSGDRMEFVQASALPGGKVLAVGRQAWTGRLGGCGEGFTSGATSTFIFRQYITDQQHSSFDRAFENVSRNVDISREQQRCLDLVNTSGLVSTLPLEPDVVLVSQFNPRTSSSDYYRMNLRTGSTELHQRIAGRARPDVIDPRDGSVLVQSRTVAEGSDFRIEYLIRNDGNGEFELHDAFTTRATDRFNVNIVGRDEQSGQYYVVTDKFSDLAAVYFYDANERQFSDEPILAHPDFSASSVILGRNPSQFNQLLGFRYLGARSEVFWLDEQMRSIQDGLDAAFPGLNVSLNSWSDNLDRILFSVSSGARAPSYYLLSNMQNVHLVGHSRPWLADYPMSDPELIYYEARDGLRIPGIVTLPAGWSPEDGPLPSIVLPHGGPWVRDTTAWDSSGWPQFLASRGYAVLQPQYRGSTGFGRELWLAGDNEWGQAMQDDKDDGAAWLVEQGIADRDRIAIFGYSYGGFAAAAAVVRENSPYRCAISGAPVTDLTRIGNNWSSNRLQRAFQGRTVSGMDPIRHTDRANIPVMLYVGDRDVRTPAFHARNFYNQVRNRVPAQLHIIRDMPHSLPWYPRHHTETLGLIENYLANDCGPGGM